MWIVYSSTEIWPIKWNDVLCAHMPYFCRPGQIYKCASRSLADKNHDPFIDNYVFGPRLI